MADNFTAHDIRSNYGIPDYIRDQAGCQSGRQLVVKILEERMPGIPILNGFRSDGRNPLPALVVTRSNFPDLYSSDVLGLATETIAIDGFCAGPDKDDDSEMLVEAAVQNVYRDFYNGSYRPGYGQLNIVRRMDGPVIGDDWGPSLGPVQYADSPDSVTRSRATLVIKHRRPTRLTEEGS